MTANPSLHLLLHSTQSPITVTLSITEYSYCLLMKSNFFFFNKEKETSTTQTMVHPAQCLPSAHDVYHGKALDVAESPNPRLFPPSSSSKFISLVQNKTNLTFPPHLFKTSPLDITTTRQLFNQKTQSSPQLHMNSHSHSAKNIICCNFLLLGLGRVHQRFRGET